MALIGVLYVTLINAYAFVMFAVDKSRAINNKTRISEKKLLTLGAIGGSVGTFFGMIFFHHKTRHAKFRVLIPLFIALHYAILVALF